MTWLYGAIGLAFGLAVGWLMCAFVSRAIEAENRELRDALRYIRDRADGHLRRRIDQLLGDEAA